MGERKPGSIVARMSVFETPVTGPIDKYVFLADRHLRLISVFDDTSYDRADADMLSPPMRQHLAKLLAKNGFKQSSGTVFKNKALNVKCIIPKAHALGASPFDVTRFTPRGDNDFYVLTPTQTACFFIDNYGLQDAFDRVVDLIRRQPINILKISDYLERKPHHRDFMSAINQLSGIQKEAVADDKLRFMKALG
ncbi:MAG: hypothetical protein AAGI14_07060 [Pseudomonadota bacterium]